MAELDAAYFLLYGMEREDVGYILSTFAGAGGRDGGLFATGSPAELILNHYDMLCGRFK